MALSVGEQEIARRVAFTPDERLADATYDASAGNRDELKREMARSDLAPGALALLQEQHKNLPPEAAPQTTPEKFDLSGGVRKAREAGYSDKEIAGFIAPKLNFDLDAAQRYGYTPSEIVDFLTSSPKASDYVKSLASGALSGVGMIAQGGGELLARGINAVAPQAEARAVNPLQPAIDWLETSKSPAAHIAEAGSQISGSILHPSTWDFGTNPTLAGLALQGSNALGQAFPNLAIAIGTSGLSLPAQMGVGAVVGGIQALGGSVDQERDAINGMSEDDLKAHSELYRTLIAKGQTPQQARAATADAAALGGGLGNAFPSSGEQVFESWLARAFMKGVLPKPIAAVLGSGGIVSRVARGALAGGAVEGTEEGIEQVGQNLGSNLAIGGDRPLTEGTLQQFVMGMVPGAVLGGGGGALSHRTPAVASAPVVDNTGAQVVNPAPAVDKAAPLLGSDFDRPAQNAAQALDQAPNADAAVAAASAIVDAPVAVRELRTASPDFDAAEQSRRQTEEEAAYQQREERIASLNRMIAMERERDAARTEAGKQDELARRDEVQIADQQDEVRGLIARNLQSAPETAMSRALAGAAGVDADAAFHARGRDILARMEALQATAPVAQPVAENATNVAATATPPLADDEIARQMLASIPANAQPQPPLPTHPLPVTILGTTAEKLSTPELRLAEDKAAKPEQRQAAKVELDRRALAYKNRSVINHEKDSLFTAIAKLGGLNQKDVVSEWGIDPADFQQTIHVPQEKLTPEEIAAGKTPRSAHTRTGNLTPTFGKPVLRINGGLSIDGMAELLVQEGYLDSRDLKEFERKFDEERRGKPVLTMQGQEKNAQQSAEDLAADERAASLELTPEDLKAVGYDKLSAPEQEQYQTILDALVEYAQGKPYEALVNEIIDRAIVEAGARPFKEYAQHVIAQIKEAINAQSTVNQPALPERGAGEARSEENNPNPHQEGRPAAADGTNTEPVRAVANGFDLTGQSAADVKAAETAKSREAAATRQREAAPPPEEFTLAGSSRPADQARARGQQELAPAQPSAQSASTQPQEVASPVHGNAAASATSPKELGITPSNAQDIGQKTERPYRDTPKLELQKLAHEAEGDTLTAVEDELNLRAEEKAAEREARLAKGRTEKAKPKEAFVLPESLKVKPRASEDAAIVDAAEAALKEKGVLKQPPKAYNDEQVDHIYDNAETRPGTTGLQQNAGLQALRGLFGGDRRAGSTILGSALWRDFQEHKGAELLGQKAEGAKDLATLAQILRDPRFETFRLFFTNGDKIVGHTGMTSRLPGVVAVYNVKPGETAEAAIERRIGEFQKMKDGFGADGYWMLHNHPSGSSQPSSNDEDITRTLSMNMVGFKGHVVIDHNEYSVINERGQSMRHEIKSGPRHEAELAHDLLGRGIHSPGTFSQIGRQLQAKTGYDVMISTDHQGNVSGIAEVPTRLLLDGARSIVRARRFAKGTGGDRVFVVSQNPSRLERLVASGAITDATDFAGHKSLRTLGIGPMYGTEEKTSYRARLMPAEQARSPYVAGKTTGDYKDSFAKEATNFITDYFQGFDKLGWWQKTVGTPFHLALENKEFRPFYDRGQAYINDISRYGNESADLAQDLLPRVEHFRDVLPAWLGGKSSAQRGDVLAASKALYAGTLWGDGSPMEGRVWTDAELKSGRAIDNGVSIPAFEPMQPKQVALYRQALAASSHTMDELAKSLIQRIARPLDIGFDRGQSIADVAETVRQQIDAKIEEAQLAEATSHVKDLRDAKNSVSDIEDKAAKLNAAGYFPAMRFGKYALHVVKDGKQLYFGMYESKTQALLAKRMLAQEFPGAEIQQGIVPKEKYKLFQGLSLDALEAFSDYIVDAEGNKVAKDALVQGLLKAATAERSVMKRHIHRKGIPGYSEDVPRVLASFVVSSARAIASNYHAADMLKMAADIKSGDVSDYATKLARYMLDPVEEAHGLRGFLFAQYLGGSIASGLVNMTQPWMTTAPWLSQYSSYADAFGKLAKASAENPDKLTGKIRDATMRAKREGIWAPQEIHQLQAETGGGLGAKNLALRKLSFAWGSIFSLAEQFNRKTTFLAAYRIADEMTPAAKAQHGITSSYDFAKQAVAETQYTYNKGNRPVASRGAVGSVVMTFKQFSISYLEMAKRLYNTDKKAFALLALTLLAAGGIEGLPFSEDLEDLVDTMGQWLGYATNSKKKVRQWATTILGPDMAQVALRGVSGLSWMPVDISARLGMANLIPGTSALKPSEKNKTKDVVEMLGPAGQFLPLEGTMVGNALERLSKGDIGGAIKAGAPKAIQAAAKGEEMLATGKATDMRGRKIENTTPGEAVLQMAGLQPASVARESQKIGIVQQDIDLQNRMKAEIAEQWARGIVDKEPDQVKAARDKMKQWNEDNKELPIHVNSQAVLQRIKEMRMTREERFVKHAPKELRGEVRQDLR